MLGRIQSINLSRGGVPKTSVFEALISEQGVDGDHQRDRRFHGGPDRAVVLLSLDVINALRREGHPIGIGTTGENLTVSGLEWPDIVPGTELAIGDLRLQITEFASPCRNIRKSFLDEDFNRLSQERHPGWSRVCARVVGSSMVRIGDPIAFLPAAEVDTTK